VIRGGYGYTTIDEQPKANEARCPIPFDLIIADEDAFTARGLLKKKKRSQWVNVLQVFRVNHFLFSSIFFN